LSKKKFDPDIHADSAEGLVVRDKTTEKGNGNRSENRSKPRNPYAGKTCNYCDKLDHIVANCWQLQNKGEKEEDNRHECIGASFAKSDFNGDVLFAISIERGSDSDWILDSRCTYHMCPHKDWFSTYDPVDSTVVYMGNNAQCNVTGIGTVTIKTHDGIVKTLSNVRHVPDLKHNLISLDTLESKGCKYSDEGGVLKVSKGSRILLKGLRRGSLYVLQASTTTNYMKKGSYKSSPRAKFRYHLNSTSFRIA